MTANQSKRMGTMFIRLSFLFLRIHSFLFFTLLLFDMTE